MAMPLKTASHSAIRNSVFGCYGVFGLAREGIALNPPELKSNIQQEHWVVDQIPFPQTPRFLEQRMQPLHSRRFDPCGCVFHMAGMNVGRGSDPDQQLGI